MYDSPFAKLTKTFQEHEDFIRQLHPTWASRKHQFTQDSRETNLCEHASQMPPKSMGKYIQK